MRKHLLVAGAAVVACSTALIANPVAAIAANDASTQSSELVAVQANAADHSKEIHCYDTPYTEADLLTDLKRWWPSGGPLNRDYGSYRLTLGSMVYEANANDSELALPSGTYKVEAKYRNSQIYGSDWHELGTFKFNRYWQLSSTVTGNTSGGVEVKADGAYVNTLHNTGTAAINEGQEVTLTPAQIDGYDVTLTVDGEQVTLDGDGSYTIPARTGSTAMKDTRFTAAYTKTPPTLETFQPGALYSPDKQATLDALLSNMIDDGTIRLADPKTGDEILDLTTADFELTTTEDALNAGERTVSLTYKGTIGGRESKYGSFTKDVTVEISPITLRLSWAQALGEAPEYLKDDVDGVIAYDDLANFDFDVKQADGQDVPTLREAIFYNGKSTDPADKLDDEDLPTGPGLYTEVVALADENGNYVADPIQRTFVVDRVPTTLVFDEEDVHVTYDGAAHGLETAHAQRNDEDVTLGSVTYRYVRYEGDEEVYNSDIAPTDAGEYRVIATYWDKTGYYADSEATATLTIDPRPISIKVDSAKKTEGEADPRLTFTVTEGTDGWAGADSLADALNATVTRDAGEAPGEYAMGFMAENGSNFEITVELGTFTIEKKATPVPVTPNNPGTGSATKPAAKKTKAALPQTGDASTAAPLALGAAGVAALAAAAVARRRND